MSPDLREQHKYDRGKSVKIYFNDEELIAYEGENLAAALYSSNKKTLRYSSKLKMPRGIYCLIGSCQECILLINGKKALACLTRITENMNIESINVNDNSRV